MQFTPTQKSVASWSAIAAFIIVFLWLLGPVLTPFVLAAVFAYALTPLVDRLDRKRGGKLPRVVAVLLVQFMLFVVLLGVALLIVPILAKEVPLMREQVPVLFERFNALVKPLLERMNLNWTLDVENIKAIASIVGIRRRRRWREW
jgi:predicted PurR-regulated permease PerM